MRLHRIQLQRFRNYQELDVQFSQHTTLFLGENGVGKSNLLEAIKLLLTGDSFRSSESLVQKGQEDVGAHLKGYLLTATSEDSVSVGVMGRMKSIRLNEKRVSRAHLAAKYGCVVFSPEGMSLIKSGPDTRRTAVDDVVLSLAPAAARIYNDFQKALRTRNRLLKEHKEGKSTFNETLGVLESLDESYLNLAVEVTELRINAIRRMIPIFRAKVADILGSQNVDISVNYVISDEAAIAWNRNQVYDHLLSRKRELQAAELASGQSLVGPQRHDIQFLFEDMDARSFCSQGQQRALILAFKMAHIAMYREERGEYPVLLLDDVFSELDIERRGNLLEVLQGLPTQIFVTTTDVDNVRFLKDRELTVFDIQAGKLTARDGIRG